MNEKLPMSAPASYRLLRAIFNTAVEDGIIRKSPCRVRGAGRDRSAERIAPTDQEVQRLIRSHPENLRLIPLLVARGGLRSGEVLGLQRRDIDLTNGAIHVRRALIEPSNGLLHLGPTKNGDSRTIHPPEDVVQALRRHLAASVDANSESPLFKGRNGERLRPGSYRRAWSAVRKKCGLTTFHFHDLRHYAATQYAASGAGLQDLMYHFGWKSPTVAARYLHASARRDAELANALPPLAWDDDIEDGGLGESA